MKKKEDVPGNDGGGNLGIRLALSIYGYTSGQSGLYHLPARSSGVFAIEVSRLIGTCI